MNRRRQILAVLGASALAAPLASFAQPKQPVLIGWLHIGSRNLDVHLLAAFKEGMAAAGWTENANYKVEERWADNHLDRLKVLAEEIAAKRPAIVVGTASGTVAAAAKAARETPIVQAAGADLAAQGLVASLARPGGLITGISNVAVDVTEKNLELLLAVAPKLKRVGFLVDPNAVTLKLHLEALQRSVAQYKIEALTGEAGRTDDIEPAIARLAAQGAQGLVVMPGPLLMVERRRVANLALARRWPMIGGPTEWAKAGALLSYGVDYVATCRRAAYYVDRILKGAKPGDLPVEQAWSGLTINLRTARALKVTISPELMVRAEQVIE